MNKQKYMQTFHDPIYEEKKHISEKGRMNEKHFSSEKKVSQLCLITFQNITSYVHISGDKR